MKKSAQLSERRKLVKQELTSLTEENLSAKILQRVVSWLQKLTRRTTPMPWYISAIVLVVIAALPHILFGMVLQQPRATTGNGLFWLLSVALVVQVIPITYLVSGYVLAFTRDHIIDNLVEDKELEDLRVFFLHRLGNRRALLTYALFTSVIGSIIAISIFSYFNDGFIGLSLAIDIWIWSFCAPGIGFYYILILMQLPSHMGNYHYQVYELNPAQSEVVNHIATLFTRPFWGIAIYLAFCTCIASLFSEFLWVVFVLVTVFWIPLVIQFINSQNAINKIILSAKWQALNKLQEQIHKHQKAANLDMPGSIESLNKLMDLYERVYSTNSFKLTIKSTLEFLNQLLLPLVAFLISNYDSVLKFFKLTP